MKNTQLRMDVILHVLDYVLMRVIADAKDYALQLARLPVVTTVLADVNRLMALLLPIVWIRVIMILALDHQTLVLLEILILLVIAIMAAVDVLVIVQMLAMEHVVVHVLAHAAVVVFLAVVLG